MVQDADEAVHAAAGRDGTAGYGRCHQGHLVRLGEPSAAAQVRGPDRAADQELGLALPLAVEGGVGLPVAAAVQSSSLVPEDCSTGLTPHNAANDASSVSLSGLSPAAMRRTAALSGTTPTSFRSCGRLERTAVVVRRVSSSISSARIWIRRASRLAAKTTSPWSSSSAAQVAIRAGLPRPVRTSRRSGSRTRRMALSWLSAWRVP